MTLLAAFEVLLHRYSGQDDFAIGTLTAGRGRAETEGLIGFFVNTLPLRAKMRGKSCFSRVAGAGEGDSARSVRACRVAFREAGGRVAPAAGLSRNPLVQVTFQLFNSPLPGAGASTLAPREMPVERTVSTFDLAFDLWESGAELLGRLEYSTDLFDSRTVARMLAAFSLVLEGVAADPDRRIEALPLLTADEIHRQTVEWNDTARQYPDHRCLHELFEEQAARTPHAIAVACDGEQLTYEQLDKRAERIARSVRARGAGPRERESGSACRALRNGLRRSWEF